MSRYRLGPWSRRLRAWAGAAAHALIAGALLLAPSSATAQEQPAHPTFPPNFAITNARIVTVAGPVIERGTIVVRDGVITEVGSGVSVPADAWIINGRGKTVYPGLIDAFGTLGHPESSGRRASSQAPHSWGPEDRPGTFTWRSAADDLDPADERLRQWRDAGFTTALTTLPTGLVTGEAAVINLAGERDRELVVEPKVAQRVNLRTRNNGYNGFPRSLMGIFAYLEQLHLDAKHYDQLWTAWDRDPRGRTRPEYDKTLEPLRSTRPLLFPAENRIEIDRALRTGKRLGAPIIIYGGRQAYEAVDLLRGSETPVLIDLAWPRPPRNRAAAGDVTLSTMRRWEHSPTTPARLHAAGVRFAFYTGGLSNPGEFREGVRLAIDAGLAPDAAIRALTLSAAEILGVADRLGSIEEGKIANLVITNGDILDPATRVERVIIDGHPVHPRPAARRVAQGSQSAEAEKVPGTVPMAKITGPYREDRVTLIRNATILTAVGPAIEGGDVLIRDGKIAEVGKGVKAPSGARVVDATGLYLMPGIVDAHSHRASSSVNEGAVAVSAMTGIKDIIDPTDIGLYRALAGGVTTINVLHGSANPIGGRNAILKLRWGADAEEMIMEGAPEGIKFALGENPKRGRTPARYPNSRMGVQDVIRQAFIEARDYMREWEAYEARRKRDRNAVPPRRDLKLETIAEILRGERHVHAHSYRADEILQLIRLAEEFGVRIQTLQHVLEGYKVADEIARHGAGASTFSDWWGFKMESYDAIPHNAALMTERGVLVSINSDDAEEMRHLNQEAAKSMKWGGLSELEALRLVTLNPAIQLGIGDRVGSIEVGKDADLVLYKGHPLSMSGVVQQTYVDGRLFFDIELDRQRQAELEKEKEALLNKHLPRRSNTRSANRAASSQVQEVE